MLVDNAKHLIGHSAQDAGGDIGMAVRWAGEKEPTHKGHVESCLGTLQEILRELIPGGTWDIPLMREFGYDPATQAVSTIEQFRLVFAEAVAQYHVNEHGGLAGRAPLDVWIEQRDLHGLDMVADPDHFQRAIGEVHWPSFRGDGAIVDHLRYGSNGVDDRFPLANEDILHHLALARGSASDTKKRTFEKVKIKIDPTNLGKAWLFDEHLCDYVPIPCAQRRYAEGLSKTMHERIRDFAKRNQLRFEEEREMTKVRDEFFASIATIVPEAKVAEMRAVARLHDSAEGKAFLGNALEILEVLPSPSGMESTVAHDLRTGTRADGGRVPPRRPARGKAPAKPRDPRDGSAVRDDHHPHQSNQSSQTDAQDGAYHSRRLDTGWSDDG